MNLYCLYAQSDNLFVRHLLYILLGWFKYCQMFFLLLEPLCLYPIIFLLRLTLATFGVPSSERFFYNPGLNIFFTINLIFNENFGNTRKKQMK